MRPRGQELTVYSIDLVDSVHAGDLAVHHDEGIGPTHIHIISHFRQSLTGRVVLKNLPQKDNQPFKWLKKST